MCETTTAVDAADLDDTADRVVLSYVVDGVPEGRRLRLHDELAGETFGSSFRSRHDAVREGDRFEAFVSRGCGMPVDVTLRADSVAGGTRLDGETEVVVERRD